MEYGIVIFLVAIMILGTAINFAKKKEMIIKASIPPQRMSMTIVGFLALIIIVFIVRKFSPYFFALAMLLFFGFIYFISGLLSEGINSKGIRTFSAFTMLAKFEPWSNIKKIDIDIEDMYAKVHIYGKKVASFQYYEKKDMEKIAELLKENKIETTVYR